MRVSNVKRSGLLAFSGCIALVLAACSDQAAEPDTQAVSQVVVPAELLERHDFSLADTPNKRTALAYLYSAWNDGRLVAARQAYWLPGSFTDENIDKPSGLGSTQYTISKVIEEGDHVVVLALVEGVGIGDEVINVFGNPVGPKIGDAVVEIIRFDDSGLIAEKWDTIEPLSEAMYDFSP